MDNELYSECDEDVSMGEKEQSIYCKENNVNVGGDQGAPPKADTNCGVCDILIIKDKGSLCCELCKRSYHNYCNMVPLNEKYCSLMYEAPKNIKWFCDKCVLIKEKWIKDYKKCDKDGVGQEMLIKSSNKQDKLRKWRPQPPQGSIKRAKISSMSPEKITIKDNDKCIKKSHSQKTEYNITNKENNYSGGSDNVVLNKSAESKQVFGESVVGNIDSGQSNVNDELIIKMETSSNNSPSEAGDTEIETVESDSNSNGSSKNGEDGAYYKFINSLKPDYQRNLIINKYICDTCNKSFNEEQEQCFEAHKLWHTGDKKPYKCSECDYEGRCLSFLQKHKSHYHIDREWLKCPFCEYETDIFGMRIGSLHRHMRSHPEFPFKCDECGEIFREFSFFKKHMNSHEYDRLNPHFAALNPRSPFHCRNCDRDFKTKQEEIDHKMGNNGPFYCIGH
ncbi:unnamed protein product [Meganyctiphanes norvegica]|uniref:C2H2-type domain-containing protein n=1 Tax=Meganyctiphanes norvegica TaxID=48144 RepID=A0AAV2SU55_MEGNR